MTENQIQAGSSVESLCKKCKTVTDHHVVVMAGDKIAKVECKVCNARHAFVSPKAEPKVKTPAVPRPKKAALASTKQALALAEHWEKMVTPCAKPLTYTMERKLQVGDVIDHRLWTGLCAEVHEAVHGRSPVQGRRSQYALRSVQVIRVAVGSSVTRPGRAACPDLCLPQKDPFVLFSVLDVA
jgi:hypothetical protein